MRDDVSVLYVDRLGPYPKLVQDWWDDRRDARLYDGPNPIVAHPPCGAWSSLRHLSFGAGRDCGLVAVNQVRQWGGVLEQPAGSKLWDWCILPRPGRRGGLNGGFTVEVEQVAWGHVARKKTWLYFVGVDESLVRAGIRTGGTPTHWCSGTPYARPIGDGAARHQDL
jgi:hypothetical protein